MSATRYAFGSLSAFVLLVGACDCRSSRDGDGPIPPPELQCTYDATIPTSVREALDSGDASEAESLDAVLAATLAQLEADRVRFDADLIEIYDLDANGMARQDGTSLTSVDWNPRHDAALLGAVGSSSVVALPTNDDGGGPGTGDAHGLAVLATRDGTRTLALATNPFRTDAARSNASVVDAELDRLVERMFAWLTRRTEGAPLNVVIAHLEESYWFADETTTRAWLGAHLTGSSYNAENACDGAALEGCLVAMPDLLIVSQDHDEMDATVVATVAASVEAAIARGTPVVYLQVDGGMNPLGEALLPLVSARHEGDNYWSDLLATDIDGSTLLGALPEPRPAIREALRHLQSRTYSFTLPQIAADPNANAAYRTEFGDGAEAVRDLLTDLDERGVDVFGSCGDEFTKLLVLLGDRLRQDVAFPMSTAASSTDTFLRAYFADHAVFNRRYVGMEQPDRGSFDSKDLSAVVGTERTVELTSADDFRSAGVYLLPGRTATITRTDTSDVEVAVFVNSLRSSSTHEFEDDNYGGYARPKFLRSAQVPLVSGESITFTNPYGGPLQLGFGSAGESVRVRFQNIGEHPHWRGSGDDATFASRLAAGTYDWAEVATDHFEIHSTREKMLETFEDPRWNTAAKLAVGLDRFSWNYAHVVAGFSGDDIDAEPEVVDWATARGLTLPVMSVVKHGNMDQPTCGYGCSGNPYDAGWAVDPVGHGHLHELGHSLQRGRFQTTYGAETFGNHSVTNWTPFYGRARDFEESGIGGDWGIPHDTLFAEFQAAYAAGERAGTFSTHMNDYIEGVIAADGIVENYAFLIQVMASARHANVIANGYHVIPRIHVLDSAFSRADDSDAAWTAARDALGFSTYSFAEAGALTNNDFMAIAICEATGLDYRDYFDFWGLTVSAKAKAQIALRGFPVVPRVFYAFDENAHTHGALISRLGDFARITIDGTTAWPNP